MSNPVTIQSGVFQGSILGAITVDNFPTLIIFRPRPHASRYFGTATFSFRIQKFPRPHLSVFKSNLPVHMYFVFSLTWPASMQIYWNKRKRLHKKRIQLPQEWFGTPINMAAVSLFRDTNTAAMTSCENTQSVFKSNLPVHTYPDSLLTSTPGNVGAKFASCSALREPGSEVQYSQ